MTEEEDVIVIRRGRVTVRREALNDDEAECLREIAARDPDDTLSAAEAFALGVIVAKAARRA